MQRSNFHLDVRALDADGVRVHPYKGERGKKKGFYSVNFTNDTNNFQSMTEAQLTQAITSSRIKERGTIRMQRLSTKPGDERNAFAPLYYKGKAVKDFV